VSYDYAHSTAQQATLIFQARVIEHQNHGYYVALQKKSVAHKTAA